MTKHTNPFYTIEEAIATLKNLGANPVPIPIPFRYDEDTIHWPDHILSVKADREYNDKYEYYFEIGIHVDREGFDALVKMTGLVFSREHFSDDCDQLMLRPGSFLKVFTLVAKEDPKQ